MKKYKYKGEVVKPLIIDGKWARHDEFNLCVRESDNVVIQVLESKLEEVCEFKRGDVIFSKSDSCNWVFVYNPSNNYDGWLGYYVFSNGSHSLNWNNSCKDRLNARLATPAEKQQLFSALAKGGKYWDEDALEIKYFIRVPDSIGVYEIGEEYCKDYEKGDSLYVEFNKGKQLLGYLDGSYVVDVIYKDWYEKVQCYLQPIKREELKVGDTVYIDSEIIDGIRDIDCYYKVLPQWKVMCALNDGCYVYNVNELNPVSIYKLIPIE